MINILARQCRKVIGCDLLAKPKIRHDVRLQTEKLKRTLEAASSASFTFDCVSKDKEFKGTITATEYDAATKPLVDTICDRLEEFKKKLPAPNAVREIVLVGGSSRLKIVRNVLRDTFPDASFRESINPDEAAVYGVAVLAHYSQKGLLQFTDDGFEIRTQSQHADAKPETPSSEEHRVQGAGEKGRRPTWNI